MKQPFAGQPKKPKPHAFVLDAVGGVITRTKPMFGSLALYVNERIVLILRDKRDGSVNDGVWLATTAEHHASLKREFPNMRPVVLPVGELGDWQVLASDTPDFEEAALRACELVLAGDPRIGKVPKSNRRKPTKSKRAPRTR